MSAVPSEVVIGYYRDTNSVQFASGRSIVLRDCKKNELIAVCKHLGIKFTGKPAVYFSPLVIEQGIISGVKSIAYQDLRPAPAVPAVPAVPSVPRPQPAVVGSGSLDDVVGVIVHNAVQTALDEFKAGADEVQVSQLVESITSTMFEGFRHEVTTQIDAVRPKVTQVVLPSREVVTLKGIQHKQFPQVLQAISQRVNLWLVGGAGTGKSEIAKQASEALRLPFANINCTSTMQDYRITGYKDANRVYDTTEFRTIFEHGGVFLLDEIDNANPNILGVLNSALSNGFMAFPDKQVQRHENFVAIATANTYGAGATMQYVGRNPIDGATIDRFAQLEVTLDEDIEQAMLDSVGLPIATAIKWLINVRTARKNVTEAGLKVIVSPRATLNGAKLIHAGWSASDAFGATVLKGAKADQVDKIKAGTSL